MMTSSVTESTATSPWLPAKPAIAVDLDTQKNRFFEFFTFLEREEATTSIDTTNGTKIYDRVLTVNYALPERINGSEQGWVPDMEKRKLLNLLLLGAISLRPVECCFLILISLFNLAKDAFGNDIVAEEWLKNHVPGDRTLTQGLMDDPTYVAVENDRTPATYGINVVYASW
ncbi:hypothetical protein CASFOL_011529 [Castilleja foliolosa]|uniref:Uncharacterized protein n=1 Tax=Castilleja foliolosa TaxID=1961234 RepID=A0ABD3DWR5_9LAMI